MPILAMAVPRHKYLGYLNECAVSVKLHLIKALIVNDIHTQKWLKDAEKPLVLNFNRECKTKLKPSDFVEIYNDFTLEEHNLEGYIKLILKAYSNNVFLKHIETETLTIDINEIIEDIVLNAQRAKLNQDEIEVGIVTKSTKIHHKLKEYEILDTFEVRNQKDAERLLKNIKKGIITL